MAPFVPTVEQEAILQHEVGRHARILAGPGTGKSATIIAWLSHHNPERARLLTFTRAATGELVRKLQEREEIQIENTQHHTRILYIHPDAEWRGRRVPAAVSNG